MASTTGILVVGHGTRDRSGREELEQVVEQVRQRLAPLPVAMAYLELAKPSIEEAIAQLLENQISDLMVAPVLLFAAGHAKRDIPQEVAHALRSHQEVTVHQTEPIGLAPQVVELSALRCQRVIDRRRYLPDADTVLVLVGRGSRDPEAVAGMTQLAQARGAGRSYAEVATCFLAMAEPRLEPTLRQVGRPGVRRVLVQPHLLFRGQLLERLAAEVAAAEAERPELEWVVVPHLGSQARVVEAVVQRIDQVRNALT